MGAAFVAVDAMAIDGCSIAKTRMTCAGYGICTTRDYIVRISGAAAHPVRSKVDPPSNKLGMQGFRTSAMVAFPSPESIRH